MAEMNCLCRNGYQMLPNGYGLITGRHYCIMKKLNKVLRGFRSAHVDLGANSCDALTGFWVIRLERDRSAEPRIELTAGPHEGPSLLANILHLIPPGLHKFYI